MKQLTIMFQTFLGILLPFTRSLAMKGTYPKLCLGLLLLPAAMVAQVKERQAGDTTYYKTLIPEEKQGLLKNVNSKKLITICSCTDFSNCIY